MFVRFVITGGSAASIFVATASALRSWTTTPPYLASGAAFLVSFAYAYPLQRRWTFGRRHEHRIAFPRYLAAQVACLTLSALLSQTLVVAWGAQPFVMAVLTAGIVSAVSFVLTRYWGFA